MGNKQQLSRLFKEACETDADLLDRHHDSIDWLSADAARELREHFTTNAEQLWEACCALSERLRRPGLTVLRNALTRRDESSRKEKTLQPYDRVNAYYVTLSYLQPLIDQPEIISDILEEAEPPATTGKAVLAALNDAWPPSESALRRMLKEAPLAYASAVLELHPVQSQDQLVNHLKDLSSTPLHENTLPGVQRFATDGLASAAKLEQTSFESLPESMKALILADDVCRQGLLNDPLLNTVDDDPLFYISDPRSAAYVRQLCEAATKSITWRGYYQSEAIARLVQTDWRILRQHKCLTKFFRAVESDIHKNYGVQVSALPQTIPESVAEGWPDRSAVHALALVFSTPKNRGDFIAKLDVNTWMASYIEALPSSERLDTLQLVIQHHGSQQQTWDWLINHFGSWNLAGDDATSLLSKAYTRVSGKTQKAWLRDAAQNDINRLISHKPAFADSWLKELLKEYEPTAEAEPSTKQKVLAFDTYDFPDTHWSIVAGAEEPLRRRFVRLTINTLLNEGIHFEAFNFEQCLLLQPDVVRASIHEQSSENKLQLLRLVISKILDVPSSIIEATGVLELPYDELSSYIAEAFEEEKPARQVVHFLASLPRDTQANVVLDHPKTCFHLAEESLSDRQLFALAIRFKEYQGLAEKRLTFEERIKLIGWARESKAPLTSLNQELATVFGARFFENYRQLAQHWFARIAEGIPPGHRFDDLYRTYDLPKRHGGTRTICVPSDGLKRAQRNILDCALERMAVHPAAHGFRKACSIVTNAAQHVGRKVVVNVDIRGFFPNTRFHHIYAVFKQFEGGIFSKRACFFLTDMCSYQAGLPTGAPTSPAIGNLILRSADASITKAAHRYGITYTRYADDLTFSGDDQTPKILPFVEKVLSDYDYELDPSKRGIFRKGRQQPVTGLLVNEKANLTRRRRRRLRAAVHHRRSGRTPTWHGKPLSDRELLGHLAFLNMVQPEEAALLQKQLKACMGEEAE